MIDKRGLQSQLGLATAGGAAIGTVVPANMRRYIYKIKTANQVVGPNQLVLWYTPDAGVTLLPAGGLDYIEHAVQYGMWNDPDELKEDALPIYIIPAGNQLWGVGTGNCYVYILYEDAE